MPPYAIAAAILVACCWGGNFSASKFAMMDFPPFLTVILRFVCVSALLAPWALRKRWPRLRDMAFLAFTLIVLHFALIFVAMSMGLNLSSVIVATQMGVPFACVISAVMFKDYLGPWRSLGLMVAFMGVLMVALTPNASQHWQAFMLATFGALAWAAANIYLKRLGSLDSVDFLFWPGLLSLPVLLVLSALFEHDQWQHITQARWTSWAGIAYSTVFSSLVGYSLWNWLVKRYPLSQVIPYSLCVPVAGIACGVVFFHEALTTQVLIGASLTILGVGIIAIRRPTLAELEQI
jgi:O-acetylserine/cysteine efflux transporter